jgi:hypothetical protein
VSYPRSVLFLFRSTVHLLSESVEYYSIICQEGWEENKNLFVSLFDIMEVEYGLISLFLPGDEGIISIYRYARSILIS